MSAADLIAAEAAHRRIACLYAKAMDQGMPELLAQAMTEDVVLDVPGGRRLEGLAISQNSPRILKEMYAMTAHVIHNQTLTLTGPDSAEGETYCTASHVDHPKEGEVQKAWAWVLRYQDTLRRDNGEWKFSYRKLIVDWTERRPIELMQGGSK